MRFRSVCANLLIYCSVLSVGCSRGPEQSGAKKEPPFVQKVKTAPAQQAEIVDYVELVARMEAFETVKIQSRVSGFLKETHFVDGEKVERNDRLFTIEPDQYEAVVEQAQARVRLAESQLKVAEKTFARSQELIKTNAISREEFEEDQAEVEQALARLVAAQADAAKDKLELSYTEVVSPISGRVDRALVDTGNFVTGGFVGGTLLTTVVNSSPVRAVANVDENLRLKVVRRMRELGGEEYQAADQVAELKIPCYLQLADEQDFPHEGVIEYVEVLVNESTGTSQVRGEFENSDELIKPGMFARLKVPVSEPYSAVLIPDVAVGADQTSRFVYVVSSDNQVEQRFVELGDRRGNLRVVKDGLEPGESVVVAGMNLIQDGSAVDPDNN